MLDNASKTEGFAQRLRTLRKARDLSQSQLGERAGLHYTHIGRFERRTSRPGSDTLLDAFLDAFLTRRQIEHMVR